MPKKKNVKPIPYNSEDAYNLEEVTEDQKKVKAKDVFENYSAPKQSTRKKIGKQQKQKKKTS